MDNPEISFEKLMVSLGIERFNETSEKSPLSSTKVGSSLIRGVLKSVIDGLDEWIVKAESGTSGRYHSAYHKLKLIPTKVAAFISVKVLLDKMSVAGTSETSVAIAIGREIELEYKLQCFKKMSKSLFKKYMKVYNNFSNPHTRKKFIGSTANRVNKEFEGWDAKECCVVGMVVLDVIRKTTGLFDVKRQTTKPSKTQNVLFPSDECLKWIESASEDFCLMSPMYLPMVEKPLDWTTNFDGGYFSGMLRKDGLLRARDSSQWLEEDFNAQNYPEVFDAVNAIQGTPWRINLRVYEVYKKLWESGGVIPGIGSFDPLVPPDRPTGTPTNKEMLEFRWAASKVYKENASRIGRKVLCSKLVAAISHFLNEPRFYYPQKMDFRGRIYPVPSFFTPQAHDIAKGVLEFSEGKEVTLDSDGVDWLMVHGANCFGFDKVGWDERIKWVKDNTSKIVASIEGKTDWWMDADKPFQFLAFCFEYAELITTGRVDSHIPVSMDGSNNGLQIFSLLLRDPVGGKFTNCSPSAIPQDIYQKVADIVTSRMREERQDWQLLWLDAVGPKGFDRKFCKRPVMTLPYGVTLSSARDYIMDWANDFLVNANIEVKHSAMDLTKMTMAAVSEVVPKTVEAMKWLQKCARVISKEGKPITWTTPLGMKLTQRYPKCRSKRIRTMLGDSIRDVTLSEADGVKLDVMKMVNAIAPNIVHSLDAAALYLTVYKCLSQGVTSFAMVHDSFGTHAADAPVLADALRQSYSEIFGGNYLLDLHKELQSQTEKELPLPPDQGTLDPNSLHDSLYFFL